MCLAPARSSWSSFVPDHTVPYGTPLLGGVFPGTSCQATIAPSLRDNSQQALARCCCEMPASASRRDDTDRSLARSAWESVPRKNRPVGYGMIRYEGRLGRLSRALNRYGDLPPGPMGTGIGGWACRRIDVSRQSHRLPYFFLMRTNR